MAACWRIGSDDVSGLVLASPDGTLERHVYDGYCYDLELAGDRAVAVLASDHRAEVRSRRLDGSDRRSRGARSFVTPISA